MASVSVETSNGDSLRTLPIYPSAMAQTLRTHHDVMDTSSPPPPSASHTGGGGASHSSSNNNSSMAAPARTAQDDTGSSRQSGSVSSPPGGAAAAVSQPKVIQTAFIHKLYRSVDGRAVRMRWACFADLSAQHA